ncbi:transporter substrate-binding domain-containing protein [Haloferula sp. BvORR071]|uniref:transporter substrate-binding domain-containing protein n=1 Tax=Haloferula sp. BvORR071 TaxID=1396141 RepID=UPI000555E32C|nr:transporter substrate-binding domain-containing protein [Haloferula sp. BvORR071]
MPRLIPLLLCLLLAACGGKKDNSLRIGMELTYPPFEMKDAQGNPDGVGVKMAEALAKELGRPLKIVPMEFTGLMPALQSGSVDLVISSMTASEERRKSIDFSEPYAFTGLSILVGKDSTIQSVEDLKKDGIKLALKAGTTAEIWANANTPKAKVTTFSEESACVQEVAQGRADAFIYDQLSIYAYHKKNPDTTRPILKAFVEENWGVGIAKGNDELKGKVNAFIEKFRKEGGFGKLGDQYLKDEKKALEGMGVPFILR